KTVVDIVASLSTGRRMHVENYVQTFAATPTYNSIQQFVARAVQPGRCSFCDEQTIVERNPDRIESGSLYEPDIFSSNVIVAISLPEFSGLFFSYEIMDRRLHQCRRIGGLEFEHVAFRQQPVAEVDAFQKKRCSIGRNEFFSSGCYESG